MNLKFLFSHFIHIHQEPGANTAPDGALPNLPIGARDPSFSGYSQIDNYHQAPVLDSQAAGPVAVGHTPSHGSDIDHLAESLLGGAEGHHIYETPTDETPQSLFASSVTGMENENCNL